MKKTRLDSESKRRVHMKSRGSSFPSSVESDAQGHWGGQLFPVKNRLLAKKVADYAVAITFGVVRQSLLMAQQGNSGSTGSWSAGSKGHAGLAR